MESIGIRVPVWFWRTEDYGNYASSVPDLGEIYFANYFSGALKASFINATYRHYYEVLLPKANQALKHKRRNYYNELSLEYEPIKSEDL